MNIHYEYTCNMLKKGEKALSWESFYDFLDKKQMPVFLKSLSDRLNEICINEVLSHEEDDIDTCLQILIYAYLLELQGHKVSEGEYRYLRLNKK